MRQNNECGLLFPLEKNHFFRPLPLYNYKFYFYIWATLAGIAQLVEHDLAKVGVEGPSPFSRSKIKEDAVKRLLLFCSQNKTRTREEGATKFGLCTKCEEPNFALDTNAVSASPKGQRPVAQRGLGFDNPVPALKQKKPSIKLGSFIKSFR